MRKDLYSSNPQSNLSSLFKTAFRVKLGIGLTMGIIAFGGMLGPSWPLRADSASNSKRSLAFTQAASTLPELGVSSNELITLRDKNKQQDVKIAQLNAQISSLNMRIQELNRSLFAKDNALDNTKIKSLHQKLQQKSRANAQLENKIAAMETELAAAKHKSSLVEVTIGSLSEMIAILKENKDKIFAQHLDELHQMDVLAKMERQKLQEKLQEYQSKEQEWNKSLAQKHNEMREKEDALKLLSQNETSKREDLQGQVQKLNVQIEDLTALLAQEQLGKNMLLEERETWNSYAEDLKKDKLAMEESHAHITNLLAQELLKKDNLAGEMDTWNRYTEDLKQNIVNLEKSHNTLQESLLATGHKATALDEDHSIIHVLQAYHLHNQVEEHKQAYTSVKGQHENLQAGLDAALAQRQADQQMHALLQRTISDLQSRLNKAYDTISSLHTVKEKPGSDKNLMAVAQKGVDLQYEKAAGELISALREESIRNEYAGQQNQHSQEQEKRKSLEATLANLASQSDDKEKEIAEWVAEWEKKVVEVETERDSALVKLQTYEQAQKALINQIGEVNQNYIALENNIEEDRLIKQNELVALQEQLALNLEESANTKLQLSLEKMALLLEKRNIEQNFKESQLAQGSDKELLTALEHEKNEALKNLAYAEEHQADLLKQVDGLSQKYTQIEDELKQRIASSGSSEELFLKQIQELEAMTAQLHNELADEKENFALQKEAVEIQQTELTRLFEEAKGKSDSLEKDLQETRAQHHEELNSAVANFELERMQSLQLITTAEERQNELVKQVEDLSQKYAAIEHELNQHADQANESQNNFQQQTHELETLLSNLKIELSQERDNFAQQRNEIQKHQLEIVDLSNMIESLENERSDALRKLAANEDQQSSLLQQMDSLASKYTQVEEEMKNNSGNAEQITREFHEQLETLESNVKHLEQELENERRIGKLHFENFNDSIAAVEEERDTAVKKHQVSEEDKTTLLQSLDELRNKVITLENTLTDETSRAQNVIQAMENQLETTRANLDEMHSTLMSSQDQYSSKESKFLEKEESYQNKIQTLEKELSDMQKFIDAQRDEWKTLQTEILKDLQSSEDKVSEPKIEN